MKRDMRVRQNFFCKQIETVSGSSETVSHFNVLFQFLKLFGNFSAPIFFGQTLVAVVTPFCVVFSSLEQFFCFLQDIVSLQMRNEPHPSGSLGILPSPVLCYPAVNGFLPSASKAGL